MPGPFYKANFSLSALFLPALGLFRGNMGRPGIFIQATRLIHPHNIPLMQTTSKSFWVFLTGMGDFVGLPNNITSEHLVKSCQFWDVWLRSVGEGGWLKDAGLICLWCSWKCF